MATLGETGWNSQQQEPFSPPKESVSIFRLKYIFHPFVLCRHLYSDQPPLCPSSPPPIFCVRWVWIMFWCSCFCGPAHASSPTGSACTVRKPGLQILSQLNKWRSFFSAHFSLVHDDEKEAIAPESTNWLFLVFLVKQCQRSLRALMFASAQDTENSLLQFLLMDVADLYPSSSYFTQWHTNKYWTCFYHTFC